MLEVCRKMTELDLACWKCVGKWRFGSSLLEVCMKMEELDLACLKCVGKWKGWI